MGYSVPEAAIKYKQGVGRLIRSTSDFGAILSLDERISVDVKNVTVDELLQEVVRSTRLRFDRRGNIVEIRPAD